MKHLPFTPYLSADKPKKNNSFKQTKWKLFFLSIVFLSHFQFTSQAGGLTLSDEIISDPMTGAALYGFDPVALIMDKKATIGSPAYQIIHVGKVWYFASPLNKEEFERHPDSYIPFFGGHDPVALSSGAASSGSPHWFLIENGRVMLFRNDVARKTYLQDPAIRERALSAWPKVKLTLISAY